MVVVVVEEEVLVVVEEVEVVEVVGGWPELDGVQAGLDLGLVHRVRHDAPHLGRVVGPYPPPDIPMDQSTFNVPRAIYLPSYKE